MSGSAGDDGSKPAMPKVLKNLGNDAKARSRKRPATPDIQIGSVDGSWTFSSPYKDGDLDEWEALLFESFATRSAPTFHAFTCQLAQLCGTEWHDEEKVWLPVDWELRAAIQIVRSIRPRNEAEACLAAQMVAVHLMQMKLSAQALSHSYPDPRTCAIAGKLARTYAMQLETMAKLKGKGSRQRITVRKYSQHEHKHIHLHQGGSENGNQPHGPGRTRASEIKAAFESSPSSALLSEDAKRDTVPVPSNEGSDTVPPPRRRGGVRSSNR